MIEEFGNVIDPNDLKGLTKDDVVEALCAQLPESKAVRQSLIDNLNGGKKFVFEVRVSIQEYRPTVGEA